MVSFEFHELLIVFQFHANISKIDHSKCPSREMSSTSCLMFIFMINFRSMSNLFQFCYQKWKLYMTLNKMKWIHHRLFHQINDEVITIAFSMHLHQIQPCSSTYHPRHSPLSQFIMIDVTTHEHPDVNPG